MMMVELKLFLHGISRLTKLQLSSRWSIQDISSTQTMVSIIQIEIADLLCALSKYPSSQLYHILWSLESTLRPPSELTSLADPSEHYCESTQYLWLSRKESALKVEVNLKIDIIFIVMVHPPSYCLIYRVGGISHKRSIYFATLFSFSLVEKYVNTLSLVNIFSNLELARSLHHRHKVLEDLLIKVFSSF